MTILKHLFDNNRAWSRRITEQDPHFFETLSKQQAPEYLWIGCSDSRVPANEIVGLLPGELFVHRNVANVVVHSDMNCMAVLQYAVEVLQVKHIMVVGHYGCGGVRTALQHQQLGLIDHWLRHIKDVYCKHQHELQAIDSFEAQVDRLCELNVVEQVYHVCHSTIVQNAWARVPAAISACRALEDVCGVELDAELAALRRLLLCADWIRCHSRHIYMFNAVCLMGYPSLAAMARDYPQVVARARRLSRLGGQLLRVVAGRSGRATTVRVGGFARLPEPAVLRALEPELEWALQAAQDTIALISRIPFPRFERDYRFLALDIADRDADLGLLIDGVPRPLADLKAVLEAGGCHVGPLARYALLRSRLPQWSEAVAATRLGADCRNPFKAVTVRAGELYRAVTEALAIVREYRAPRRPAVPVQPRAGWGWGAAEGAQGLWAQAIELTADGTVRQARLLSPNRINRGVMERDLLDYLRLRERPQLHDHLLLKEAGQLLGNYDPGLFQRLQLVELETSEH